MISVNGRIMYSVGFFVMLMILAYLVKPTLMFEKDDTIRKFGLNKTDTIFSLGVFTSVSAIVSFYSFCMIDLIFS